MASRGTIAVAAIFETARNFVRGISLRAIFAKAYSLLFLRSPFMQQLSHAEEGHAMDPPSKKHHLSHLPEPVAKRKTLTERGGEPIAAPSRNMSSSSSLRKPSNQSTRSISGQSNRINSSHSYSASLTGSTARNTSGKSIPIPRSLSGLKNTKRTNGKPGTLIGLSAGAPEHTAEETWDVELKVDEMESLQKILAAGFNESAGATESLKRMIENQAITIQSTHERMQTMQQKYDAKEEQLLVSQNREYEAQQRHNEQMQAMRQQYDVNHEQLRALQEREHEAIDRHDVQMRAMQEQMQQQHVVMDEQLKASKTREREALERHYEQLQASKTQEREALKRHDEQLEASKQQERETLESHNEQMRAMQQQNALLNAKLDTSERQATTTQNLNQQMVVDLTSQTATLREELRKRDVEIYDLRKDMSTNIQTTTDIQTAKLALQAKIDYLESDSKSQSQAYAQMEQNMREAIQKSNKIQDLLRREETLRRQIHNKYQELKGNIRVYCRVRPSTGEDIDELAEINFPESDESNEIQVRGQEEKSSLGTITTKNNPFNFDKVFSPASQNEDIYEELGQLVQSALDGFNVCIFAYGQTGSGKTYTMSSDDGMIPRALRQIYSKSKQLEERGWRYTIQGSFVEVYNEEINDLLGESDKRQKHEIRHHPEVCETTITDVVTIDLDSPEMVETILSRAMSKRSVAATKSNEHSSRSHSVFILKLAGENTISGEKSKGTLNLVDLAGSERLAKSQAEGARLKETQSINKSLSCLGDVIGALGQGKDGGHIPYRNSKLTYLLQYSLGGNSKTLMFVMVSPLKQHLGETLASLKFATKVHNTHVGVAKKAK